MRDTRAGVVERRLLKNFDFPLLYASLGILGLSCAMIYSASRGGSAGTSFVEKQVIWAVIGFMIAAVVAGVDHNVYSRHSGKLYVLNILVLLFVKFAGHSSKGAQRWIGVGSFTIQPSEFAKIIMVICLAAFLMHRKDGIRGFGVFVTSFLYLAVPMGLIFLQPDLGTSLVLVAIWITMMFVMGTDIKNILLFFAAGTVLALTAWNVPGVMKDYQKNRVITFVNPAADPLGSGYHVTQSRIAIGSGKLLGKGYLKGTQRELRFIPEQHTDFIYTVVGEEMGFAGAAAVLALYFVVLWRGLAIMYAAEDWMGRAIASGVVGMFAFHTVVNIGMTLGIMPVTGVPLPMFSYGGSSLMANMIGIGLLEGISMRRHKISF
jgi:rod shape determining protein RodA